MSKEIKTNNAGPIVGVNPESRHGDPPPMLFLSDKMVPNLHLDPLL